MTQPPQLRVTHLRQASGAGGGADGVVADLLAMAAGSSNIQADVVYLRKPGTTLQPIIARLTESGLPFREIPGRALLDPVQLFHLARFIAREKTALLHCHDPKSDFYGVLLGRLFPRLTLFSTLHGWTRRHRKGRFHAWFDQRLLRAFHGVTAVSQALALEAAEAGVHPVTVLDNGIDTCFWSRNAAQPATNKNGNPTRLVGFAGRLSAEKDPATFLQCAARVGAQFPHSQFLVAGEGAEWTRLQSLAVKLNLGNRVRFFGHLDRTALRAFYSQLDLLVLTSRSEGLPLTLLEGCAMAVPIVATRVGGVATLIASGQSGLLAEAGDVAGLAGLITRLLADPVLARRLAAQGRRTVVERFSLQERWHILQDRYEAAIGKKIMKNYQFL